MRLLLYEIRRRCLEVLFRNLLWRRFSRNLFYLIRLRSRFLHLGRLRLNRSCRLRPILWSFSWFLLLLFFLLLLSLFGLFRSLDNLRPILRSSTVRYHRSFFYTIGALFFFKAPLLSFFLTKTLCLFLLQPKLFLFLTFSLGLYFFKMLTDPFFLSFFLSLLSKHLSSKSLARFRTQSFQFELCTQSNDLFIL